MTKVNVYLNFPGNTEEVFQFYRSVFGGEIETIMRFKDMPMEGFTVSKDDEDKIMHIALPIGPDHVLMGSDALESMDQKLVQGNNVHISLETETKQEADRLFNALSGGGEVEMPMADQPWGDYFGSFKDQFGVYWMVSYALPTG